jgi:hypothetical protein
MGRGHEEDLFMREVNNESAHIKAAGASVRLLEIAGAGHSFGSGCGGKTGELADDATVRFLRGQLQSDIRLARHR